MPLSARQFLESLSSLGLLSQGDLSGVRDKLTDDQLQADAETLARDLIRSGKLSKYQAAALYSGKGKGLVFGEYVVLDKLGSGGMGQVFKAQHRRMKRMVALKVLPPHATKSPQSVQRFYQQVELAAKLNHPNIVTAYDAGEAHGLHYLVMEFVDGSDLYSIVAKQGVLTVEQAMNCIRQAADGLQYAHEQGIVHRDIKPANLLIDKQGRVKVLDMGLARSTSAIDSLDKAANEGLTQEGQVMGTVDYMAPEQARDTRHADHRADIYSLGCTLYRLLTGQLLYPADTMVKKIMAHAQQPIPSLRAVRPEVPPALDSLFQRMVAKDPAQRVQSAGEVSATLRTLLAGCAEEASSVSVLDESAKDEDLQSFLKSGVVGIQPTAGKRSGGSCPDVAKSPKDSTSTRTTKPKLTKKPIPTAALAGGALLIVLVAVGGLWLALGGKNQQSSPPQISEANPASNPVSVTTASASKPSPDGDQEKSASDPTTPSISPKKEPAPSEPSKPEPASPDPAKPSMFNVVPKQPERPKPNTDGPKIKPTGPTDVLALIDLERDVKSEVWIMEAGVLTTPAAESQRGHLQLPIEATGDFALGLTVQRVADAADASFGVTAPIADREVAVRFQGNETAIEGPDSAKPENTSARHPQNPLANPDVHQLLVQVVGSSIQVNVDGKPVVSWQGDASQMQSPKGLPAPIKQRRMLIESHHGSWRVTKIDYRPLKSGPAGKIDLLSSIDLARDRILGVWTREDQALLVDRGPSGNCPQLQVPYVPPAAYRLTLELARRFDDQGYVLIGLPFPGGNVQYVAHCNPGGVGGLLLIDGKPQTQNETTYFQPVITSLAPHTLVFTVAPGVVLIECDGRRIGRWEGDFKRLTPWLPQRDPAQPYLYLEEVAARITRWEVEPLVSQPAIVAALADRILPPQNLLATADLKRDSVDGEWNRDREGVTARPEAGKTPRLALKTDTLTEPYTITAIVERREGMPGHLGLGFGLPIRGTRLCGILDYDHRVSGLYSMNTGGGDINASAFTDPSLLLPGRQALITWSVTPARIECQVNGRRNVSWDVNLGIAMRDPRFEVPDPNGTMLVGDGFRVLKVEAVSSRWRPVAQPPTADVENALKTIRQTNSLAYDKNVKPDTRRLAGEALYRAAAQDTVNSALHFARLQEAVQHAAGGGDLTTALLAIEDLRAIYEIDTRPLEKGAVADAFKVQRPAAARQPFVDEAMRMIERALLLERFDLAADLLAAVQVGANKAGADIQKELRTRAAEYKHWKTEWDAAQQARASLDADPNDRIAHITLGRYQGIVRNDWVAARQSFQRADDKTWSTIAEAEAKPPTELAEQAAQGDRWWSLADKAATPLKSLYQERADVWYRRASLKLSGAAKATIDKRRDQLQNQRKTTGALFAQRHPLDAVKIGDHWYKLYVDELYWDQARITCERLGGQLVVIESDAENQAVAAYAINEYKRLAGVERLIYWLGASDAETEGTFRWVNGRPLDSTTFAGWVSGQPDNNGGNEDFVFCEVFLSGGQRQIGWQDTSGGGHRGCYVCEWDW